MTGAPCAGGTERLRLRDGTTVTLHAVMLARHAALPDDQRAAVRADAGGCFAGEASYERVYGPRATLRIEVDEAYWHRGLPAVLLTTLGARAGRLGISTFVIRVRARDVRLLALLRQEFGAHGTRDGAWVQLDFPTGRSG
jgi:hypothetical protein